MGMRSDERKKGPALEVSTSVANDDEDNKEDGLEELELKEENIVLLVREFVKIPQMGRKSKKTSLPSNKELSERR